MFENHIDIDDNYFYMEDRMESDEVMTKYGLVPVPGGYYYQEKSATTWRKVTLYGTGWAQLEGFERLPPLPFESLIELALRSDHRTTKLTVREENGNVFGAIAIIMERHMDELIGFLSENLDNDELFGNGLYRSNLKLFCFDDTLKTPGFGGIGGRDHRSYEEMLDEHPGWHRISQRVIEQVYIPEPEPIEPEPLSGLGRLFKRVSQPNRARRSDTSQATLDLVRLVSSAMERAMSEGQRVPVGSSSDKPVQHVLTLTRHDLSAGTGQVVGMCDDGDAHPTDTHDPGDDTSTPPSVGWTIR